MRIAIFETEQWEHAACLGLAPTHKVTCHRERLDAAAAALAQDAEVVSAFVNSTSAPQCSTNCRGSA
jgi:D-lactate dehydrogenase